MYQPPSLRRANPGNFTANPVGRRSAARLRLSIPARLTTLYETRPCIVIDISQTGAQIALPKPLRIGQGAVLQVATIEPFGDIVRDMYGPNGGTNGLAFDSPLSEVDVLAVRSFSETFEKDEIRRLRREARRWVSGF